MKFEVEIAKKDSIENSWIETYEKNVQNPEQWARKTIKEFNRTLRPGEEERIFLKIKKIIDFHSVKNHYWEKQNLVTVVDKDGNYDIMKCNYCGITGKRYGMGLDGVVRDAKYSAAIYDRCDTSLKHLKKKNKT